MDPWTVCNINCARIRIAHGKAGHARMRIDTQNVVALVSHLCIATTKEDSHLMICPYNAGVGTAQSEMPLHVVGCSLLPFRQLMSS